MTGITLTEAKGAVGPGWAPLLERAYAALPEDAHVLGVKEKWGLLRITVTGSLTDAALDTLDAIEDESGRVCEQCGRPAATHTVYGWIRTLCDGCYLAALSGETR